MFDIEVMAERGEPSHRYSNRDDVSKVYIFFQIVKYRGNDICWMIDLNLKLYGFSNLVCL